MEQEYDWADGPCGDYWEISRHPTPHPPVFMVVKVLAMITSRDGPTSRKSPMWNHL